MFKIHFNRLNNYDYSDEHLDEVKEYVQKKILPDHLDNRQKNKFIFRYKDFKVDSENRLIYIPLDLESVYESDIDNKLQKLYDDPKEGIAVGIGSFYNKVVQQYLGIKRDKVKEFLSKQTAYQLTKAKPHLTNKAIITDYPNQRWGSDLVDVSNYSGHNAKKNFILTVIDYFSKYVFAVGLPNKNQETVIKGFDTIVKEQAGGFYPRVLQSDNGGEFKNASFNEWAKRNNIKLVHTLSYTPQSNGLIENFNGILRKMMREGFIRNNNLNWTKGLPDYLYNRNHSKHSTTKYLPADVWRAGVDKIEKLSVRDQRNIDDGQIGLNKDQILNVVKKRTDAKGKRDIERNKTEEFEQGDHVRVLMSSLYSKVRKLIKANEKKYVIVQYTPEIYQVDTVLLPSGVKKDFTKNRYTLVRAEDGSQVLTEQKMNNPNKERRSKYFFASELQKVDKDSKSIISEGLAAKFNGVVNPVAEEKKRLEASLVGRSKREVKNILKNSVAKSKQKRSVKPIERFGITKDPEEVVEEIEARPSRAGKRKPGFWADV